MVHATLYFLGACALAWLWLDLRAWAVAEGVARSPVGELGFTVLGVFLGLLAIATGVHLASEALSYLDDREP